MFGCFLNYVGVHKPQAGIPGFLKLPLSLRLGINIVKGIYVTGFEKSRLPRTIVNV